MTADETSGVFLVECIRHDGARVAWGWFASHKLAMTECARLALVGLPAEIREAGEPDIAKSDNA